MQPLDSKILNNVLKTITAIYNKATGIDGEENEKYDTLCLELSKNLTKLIPDTTCTQVMFSNNTDKNFFGIYVFPRSMDMYKTAERILVGYTSETIQTSFERFDYTQYAVDLDGKLFRDFSLTPMEITALLLSEINGIIHGNIPYHIRSMMDIYIMEHDVKMCPFTIMECVVVFDMVCGITAHNITSMFAKPTHMIRERLYSGESTLVTQAGLQESLHNAIERLTAFTSSDNEVYMPSLLMGWFLTMIQSYPENTIDIQHVLQDSSRLESSTLIRSVYYKAFNSITITPLCDKYHMDLVHESKRKGLIYQMKRNGLKSIEEDLFEYKMRLRNVNTQDEAILLMRQLNSRMTILEDYLAEENITDEDRKRWEDCYNGYLELRSTLSSKSIYDKKMYGLFVDYNALQQMSQTGQLNTYY